MFDFRDLEHSVLVVVYAILLLTDKTRVNLSMFMVYLVVYLQY